MKAWIIVTDDFKTYYAKEVEGKRSKCGGVTPIAIRLPRMVGFHQIYQGKLVPRMDDVLHGVHRAWWLTKEACESAIRGVMG